MERGQKSYSARVMAQSCRLRAKETGKPHYLIYDVSWKSYFACSAPDNGWDDSEKFIKRFLPDGSSDEINDIPERTYPEPTKEQIKRSEQLIRELDLVDK